MLFKVIIAAIAVASVASAENTQPSSGTLVLGGKEAPVGKYTYTAGLRETKSGGSFCGGTLVSPQYIVTAAHCTAGEIKYASIGTHFSSGARDGVQVEVESVIAHPKFNANKMMSDDIAIVKLKHPVKTPVAFLGRNIPSYTKKATVHGWGRTAYPGNGSPVLKEIDLKLISPRECQQRLGSALGIKVDSNSIICAGGIEQQSACHGDSGGPLVLNKNSRNPILIGAVSFGLPCGKGAPDAFSRISYNKKFIDEHVKGHKWVRV